MVKSSYNINFLDLSEYVYGQGEPLLGGHLDERPTPLERPLDNVNLNINVLISTPDERPLLSKGHLSGAKGMVSQEGFHSIWLIWSPIRHEFL